jgi:hypothetical protein
MLIRRVFIDLKHYMYAGKKSFYRFKTLLVCWKEELVFRGVSVTRCLVLYVCFVDRCLTFSFDHCVVCSSSIYGF